MIPQISEAADLLLPPILEPRRSRLGVAGQVLDILERHALRQQIGDQGEHR